MAKVSLKGGFIMVALLWSAMVGSILFLTPALMLLLLPFDSARVCYRQWSGFIAKMWFSFATFLLEEVGGVEVVLSGDTLPFGEPAMIICNHRTRIDWMFMWSLCLRLGILDSMKIVLKDSLKSIPGFGWAMQSFMFLFLARDKSVDLQHMSDVLNYHVSNDMPLSLILFPEGTDLSRENMVKSDAFAAQNSLPRYKYVLHPKVVGWARSVALLRGSCPAVYDVTIGYHDYVEGERPNEMSILAGRLPKSVHLHVQRHPMPLLPEAPGQVEDWLKSSFARKEKRLLQFYTTGNKKFPELSNNPPSTNGREREVDEWRKALVFWGLSSLFSIVCLSLVFGWFYCWLAALCWFLITKSGGAEVLELRLHGERGIYKKLLEDVAD
mmetsp:Transcript_11986/g.17293  ORF Transcript_11986/g.17293 Transcript_11986/m.17293 type:complete len:382 (+) Transcript_11986:82-1227(+)|eukprot:CAMPEP_0179441688 /NCGR_PEP_ID=MMETSP0799-20121207/25206_1 /TAXON_ID=46947 /ORGANISM="Geminigera cryophila, Strain CCMP2564" /LENGTH=381 /DNA_ID=CAMNT_0021226125 /DNA_START=85 /DNA_END=1230 /DNA_ORIENTATION=+